MEARSVAGNLGASRPRELGAAIDLSCLAGALRLIGAAFLPVAVLTALIWAAVYLAFRLDPDYTRYASRSLGHTIVQTQLDRIRETTKPSLALVGDSSCTLGIHVPTLRQALSDDRVESFCTFVNVGPAGFAHMIDMLMDRGAAPERLVIALHPGSLLRQPDWDQSARLVLAEGREPERDSRWPADALSYARTRWLDPIIPRPMDNPYGFYYGGYSSVRSMLHADHGSAIDAQSDFSIRSLEQFSRARSLERRPARTDYPYAPTAAFNESLRALAKAVARLGAARVYLLLTPIPDTAYSAAVERAHDAAVQDIAHRLGIPANHVLPVGGSASYDYFTPSGHLDRWGRILYTKALAQHLASIKTASH